MLFFSQTNCQTSSETMFIGWLHCFSCTVNQRHNIWDYNGIWINVKIFFFCILEQVTWKDRPIRSIHVKYGACFEHMLEVITMQQIHRQTNGRVDGQTKSDKPLSYDKGYSRQEEITVTDEGWERLNSLQDSYWDGPECKLTARLSLLRYTVLRATSCYYYFSTVDHLQEIAVLQCPENITWEQPFEACACVKFQSFLSLL